ncbi:MAG: hypothetical protein INR71_03800 [Terriglobus roseus]|nr:hypothetical protein [Terriglobus roseus]
MTLSLYRINKTAEMKAVFITFAAVNALYCTLWDLVMDWSLLDPYAPHPFLRRTLGYKQVWLYYLALAVDPILRFNWIFYAIFADDVQHSALLSFFVSLSEVGRRGLWMLLRVENEHCTNVGRFRASRDVPLPYTVDTADSEHEQQDSRTSRSSTADDARDSLTPIVTATPQHDVEAAGTGTGVAASKPSPGDSLRRRRAGTAGGGRPPVTPTLRAVGSLLHMAHAQDYAKKKRPNNADEDEAGSSDEENEREDEEETERLRQSADLAGARDMVESNELMRDGEWDAQDRVGQGGESSGSG